MNKPKHTYCFYMSNGEHITVDADDIYPRDEEIALCKDVEGEPKIFMHVYNKYLMACEELE